MSFLEALGGHISYLFPGKVQGSPVCLSSASAAQGPKQHRCLFLWAGNTFRASFFLLLMHLLVIPRSLSPGHWFPVLETCSHVPESASSRGKCVPELEKGDRRCLSTHRLLPASPAASFPKQTGGLLQVSPGQRTAGFAARFLQGEEQASALLWGKQEAMCVCVCQASRYSGKDI